MMQWHFLLSYLLVFAVILYSLYKQLGVEKQIAINSLRTLVQLFLLGIFLSYIFSIEGIFYYFIIFVVMILFGAYTAHKRVGYFLQGIIAMGSSSFIVLITLILLDIVSLRPNELIPIGGMIIGSSLNIYTLFVERYKREIQTSQNLIEQYLALGVSEHEAMREIDKISLKAALIPIMNTMQTVGIIHIPGIMAGMMIAGADPMSAVLYQVVIIYMMLSVALFTAIAATLLLRKKLLQF